MRRLCKRLINYSIMSERQSCIQPDRASIDRFRKGDMLIGRSRGTQDSDSFGFNQNKAMGSRGTYSEDASAHRESVKDGAVLA